MTSAMLFLRFAGLASGLCLLFAGIICMFVLRDEAPRLWRRYGPRRAAAHLALRVALIVGALVVGVVAVVMSVVVRP